MEILRFERLEEKKKQYLAIYDIANDVRRRKISKHFEEYGMRIQESAFLMILDDRKYRSFISRIPYLIEEREDAVWINRIYPEDVEKFGYKQTITCGFDAMII